MQLYLFLIFSLFIFSCLELFTQKNEYIRTIQKIYISIVFVLLTFNRKNSDYKNYLKVFDGEKNIVSEKGYLFFVKILKILGGNHNLILLILGCLFFFVIFYLYKKKYEITFIFLYLIYLFMYDINQIRNLFCILFILIGIKFLGKNKKYFYLIFNILAVSFQRLGYIYFIFYFLQKLKLRNYLKVIGMLFMGGIFFIPIFKKMMIILFQDKAMFYFAQTPRFGMLLYYIFIVMDIFLLKKLYYKNNKELLLKFILFPIIFLPYSILSIELIRRIWRNTLYLKWFYFLKLLENENYKKKVIVYFVLFSQQFMILSIEFFKDPRRVVDLISQIKNINFYI